VTPSVDVGARALQVQIPDELSTAARRSRKRGVDQLQLQFIVAAWAGNERSKKPSASDAKDRGGEALDTIVQGMHSKCVSDSR
jgi:hypothetical protein